MKDMFLALAALCAAQAAQPDLRTILSRVAEEAELFEQNVRKALAVETLEQRATVSSTPRVRIGAAANQPPKSRLQTRKIVSEYTVAPLKGSDPPNLVEFREVISVDGRPVQSAESARHALSLGIQSDDDRVRKRMLEDFARHGLVDIATDYAPILLAFTNRGQKDLRILPGGADRVGADDALVFAWFQKSPERGELVFSGREAARWLLQGKLYLRNPDGLPLRISVWAEHTASGRTVRDEAVIDYVMSRHGFLTPASVRHRHLVQGQLQTENLFRYEPFKLFSADTQIKFSPLPDREPRP